jgi:hypothetical protein
MSSAILAAARQNLLASCLALSSGPMKTPVSAGGLSPVDEVQSHNLMNDGFSAEKPAFGSVCTSGGGPGLQNQSKQSHITCLSSNASTTSDSAEEGGPDVLASCLALLNHQHADLASVLAVWPSLPPALKAAVLAIVESALKTQTK